MELAISYKRLSSPPRKPGGAAKVRQDDETESYRTPPLRTEIGRTPAFASARADGKAAPYTHHESGRGGLPALRARSTRRCWWRSPAPRQGGAPLHRQRRAQRMIGRGSADCRGRLRISASLSAALAARGASD